LGKFFYLKLSLLIGIHAISPHYFVANNRSTLFNAMVPFSPTRAELVYFMEIDADSVVEQAMVGLQALFGNFDE
jgi:hypothetical protein